MMAILVLTTALVGMLGFLSQAIVTTKDAQKEIIARQKSREIMESIFTARNTQQITFDQIQNEGDAPGAAFLAGYQPLRGPGPDGIVGTTDDDEIETLTLPGPDGNLGTPDDIEMPLSDFERQVLISPVLRPDNSVDPSVRRVTVRVRYRVGFLRTYQLESMVSRFR
jgi:hypothetical protein